jgi:hypothetical protein
MKELLDIFPQGSKIKLGDQEVEVKDFSVQDFPKIMEVASKVYKHLETEKEIGKTVVKVIAEDFDGILMAISLSTGLEIDFLNKLNQKALIFVASEVIEVNLDFFMKEVKPMIEGLAKRLEKTTKQTGRK